MSGFHVASAAPVAGRKAREAIARLAADRGETAAGIDVAVAVDRDGEHLVVRAGVPRGVHGAVGIEARDVVARHPADVRELAADDDLAVRAASRSRG
jgi:hypothetical protein